MDDSAVTIRPIDPDIRSELAFVADRMRQTLVEVEGDVGYELYTLDWLRDRVAFHLDPMRSTGCVFVAVGDDRELVGHTIVRVEHHADGRRFGLFSTTWVEPAFRRAGVADCLLAHGEAWMHGNALSEAATWTSATNHKLIALYAARGYAQTESGPNDLTSTVMVRLTRPLNGRVK
jgi:GNAT superfamily N-acetyltransferase